MAAGVAATLLWGWTLCETFVDGRDLGVFEVLPDEYRQGHVTNPFSVATNEKRVVLQFESAVDNSWISLEVQCLREDGTTVQQSRPGISFYHGTLEGRKWETGQRSVTELIKLTPGEYRLRIGGTAGGGTSSEPDFEPFARPVRIKVWAESRFRTALLAASFASMLAGALALRQFSTGCPSVAETPANLTQRSRSERLVMLDGLRGLAALAVVFCHLWVPEFSRFSVSLSSTVPEFLSTVARHGDLGVEVFFVLSGFVIAYSVRERKVTSGFMARFAARRALRLDPPYYFALFSAIAIWAYYAPLGTRQVLTELGGVRGLLANMCYLQDVLRYRTPLSIAWTLCLEVQFYLAYIGLLCAAQVLSNWLKQLRGKPGNADGSPPGPMPLLVFIPVVVCSAYIWYDNPQRFDFFGTWFRFFLGVMVCWVFTGQLSRWWLWGCALVLAILSILTADARGLTAVATAVFIDTAGFLGVLSLWLGARPIQLLGRISYSLYLVHIPIGIGIANFLWSLSDHSSFVAVACACLAVMGSLLAAWLAYKLVEEPSIQISKRVAC